MSEFAHDKVVPYAESKAGKKEQVASMFDSIAGKYDFLNRFLSLGIDKGWRKKAIAQFDNKNLQHLLDIATGTGDMAIMAYRQIQPQKITGVDISEGMMEVGRKKIAENKLDTAIQLQLGDSTALPFENETFDGAMVAFGVRNFADLQKGLEEIHRVLKDKSQLVIVEFSQPHSWWFKPIYQLYMKWITPNIGKLFSGNKEAYSYLNESVIAFPEGTSFLEVFNKAGFHKTYQIKLTLGICSIYCGSK